MGNKTVAPAPAPYNRHPSTDPNAPIYFNPNLSTDPNAPAPFNIYTTTGTVTSPSLYPDELMGLTETPSPPIPHTSPKPTPPITSTNDKDPVTAPIPASSPTFEFPAVPSTIAVPSVSPKSVIPAISPTTVISTVAPPIASSAEHRSAEVPANASTSRPPVPSPIPVIPPNTRLPLGPLAYSSPADPILSSTPNINSPLLSPDISAISPTLDLPPTPNGSPIPTAPSSPAKPIHLAIKNVLAAHEVHDAATSPMVLAVSPDIQTKSKSAPPKRVVPKQTVLKDPVPIRKSILKPAKPPLPVKSMKPPEPIKSVKPPESVKPIKPPESLKPVKPTESIKSIKPKEPVKSTKSIEPVKFVKPTEPIKSTKSIEPVKSVKPTEPVKLTKSPEPAKPTKPTKPTTLSSAERSSKWSEFEKEYQEQQKRLMSMVQHTQDMEYSPAPSSNILDTGFKIEPIVPDIVPVPSFPLRTTAVYNPSQNSPLPSERAQSIHKGISIFQYCLTYNEADHSISDHTRATMFKMNTRLRQIPLPIPSLALLTKNFSDGEHEATNGNLMAPSFSSLGLQHKPSPSPAEPSYTGLRIQEKQLKLKLQQPILPTNDTSNSVHSFQWTTSTVMSQADLAAIEQTHSKNNPQHFTPALKKPSSQFTTNPTFIVENKEIFQDFRRKDVENNLSPVSFKLTRPFLTKANQSISRSEKLIHRKKLIV